MGDCLQNHECRHILFGEPNNFFPITLLSIPKVSYCSTQECWDLFSKRWMDECCWLEISPPFLSLHGNFCDTESLQLIFCLLLWSCIKGSLQSVSYLATFAGFLVGKLIIERFFDVHLHNIAFIWEGISMPSFFPTSIFQWILNISFIHILSIFCFCSCFKKNLKIIPLQWKSLQDFSMEMLLCMRTTSVLK